VNLSKLEDFCKSFSWESAQRALLLSYMLFCVFKSLCRRVPGTGTAYTEELAVSGVQEGEDEFSKKVCETQAKPGIQISCKKCNGLYC